MTVGTVLGNTGNTGRSFGAHTHFEILQNGTTTIDPLPWLRTYAGGLTAFGKAPALWYSRLVARSRAARPDSSVVEHFHGKEGVVSSILTRGSKHRIDETGCIAAG